MFCLDAMPSSLREDVLASLVCKDSHGLSFWSASGEMIRFAPIRRYAPRQQFSMGAATVAVTLEALLMGHEDFVHSVAWQPSAADASSGSRQRGPCLLSASMDRTMMLWRPDEGTGGCEAVSHQQQRDRAWHRTDETHCHGWYQFHNNPARNFSTSWL